MSIAQFVSDPQRRWAWKDPIPAHKKTDLTGAAYQSKAGPAGPRLRLKVNLVPPFTAPSYQKFTSLMPTRLNVEFQIVETDDDQSSDAPSESASAQLDQLTVIGQVRAGQVVASAYFTLSDARLKEDISRLSNDAVEKLSRIGAYVYRYKTELEGADRNYRIGLLAQEVQREFPEAVLRRSDEYLAVDYTQLVPVLVHGWNAHTHQIRQQERQVVALAQAICKATKLISIAEDTNLPVVHDAGLDILRNLTAPLRVIAVVGVLRIGKSFFCNRLLDKPDYFVMSPGSYGCTHGVWVGVQSTSDGFLVVLDFEGMFDPRHRKHDPTLFALAIMLSSMLVFNVLTFDSVVLSELGFATDLITKMRNANPDFCQTMPQLLWLFRNYCLTDPTGYLPGLLAAPEVDPRIAANVRAILEGFPTQHVKCVKPPSDDGVELQLDWKKGGERFVQSLQQAVDFVHNSPAKTIGTASLSGHQFAMYAEECVRILQVPNAVPDMHAALVAAGERECAVAFDTAVKQFQLSLDAVQMPVDEPELQRLYEEQQDQAAQSLSRSCASFTGACRTRAVSSSEYHCGLRQRGYHQRSYGVLPAKEQENVQVSLRNRGQQAAEGIRESSTCVSAPGRPERSDYHNRV
eukprot:TRINITY_DN3652_c0_g1_i1.p1 TRINITY_DN3652_c0_g1~~TRINITY_DN3652_c0_g1_i1.p1  ORF type:complete len:722 (-),score=80.24 TRINITY_DN3652_c0_g1_i1:478-2370(-)